MHVLVLSWHPEWNVSTFDDPAVTWACFCNMTSRAGAVERGIKLISFLRRNSWLVIEPSAHESWLINQIDQSIKQAIWTWSSNSVVPCHNEMILYLVWPSGSLRSWFVIWGPIHHASDTRIITIHQGLRKASLLWICFFMSPLLRHGHGVLTRADGHRSLFRTPAGSSWYCILSHYILHLAQIYGKCR